MAKIQELVEQYAQGTIDYPRLILKYPWIIQRDKMCVLSPDSDGLLCGLFMSKYLNWNIVGFYDGKVLLLKNGISASDPNCIFLDMEIFRRNVKSVGHHMLLVNNKHIPDNWNNFDSCIQPNNLRKYDGKKCFRLKYPFATIHLLIGILGSIQDIDLPKSSIAPLFFVDGTFNVLYSYPENVLNWLDYLGINSERSPLKEIFMHEHFTVYSQILAMNDFFRKRDEISIEGERGDKFVISNRDGEVQNTEQMQNRTFKIKSEAQEKVKKFISLLAETTNWQFNENKWTFENFAIYRFTKKDFKYMGWTISNRDYQTFIETDPLSWAMTSSDNIEFTLETPDQLP